MRQKIRTKTGKEVTIVQKEKVFYQLPSESFLSALVRTYYPREYNRLHKPTELNLLEVLQ